MQSKRKQVSKLKATVVELIDTTCFLIQKSGATPKLWGLGIPKQEKALPAEEKKKKAICISVYSISIFGSRFGKS